MDNDEIIYYLVKDNTDIIVFSEDAHKLFAFRNSLSLAEKMQYTIVIKKDGHYLRIMEGNNV